MDSDITDDEEYDFNAMHETDEETVTANPDSSEPEVAKEEASSSDTRRHKGLDSEVPSRTEDHDDTKTTANMLNIIGRRCGDSMRRST